MRRILIVCAAGMLAGPALANGIGEVLARSQQMRLERVQAASAPESSPAHERLEADFKRLVEMLSLGDRRPELRVVSDGTIAETIEGRIVVVHESIATWNEPERLFVMAHELGHVAEGHWGQLAAVYHRHIPGEVTPEVTGPVAALLGREAASTSHRHEFEADAYGLDALHQLGYGMPDVLPVFMRLGNVGESASHPSARRRLAQLRALDAVADTGQGDRLESSVTP